ncbi:MAG: putative addiction module antidote protein [Spirochaetaceae bacterium]|jgi:probable addiction module antidote protein/putative addiction module killer protein|nr:putative addiction module antidote protein [Spirochaetaceae bacterium]
MRIIRRTREFGKRLKKLRDSQAIARILTRVKWLAERNPGDNRFLGEASKIRIDYGPGYRIYFKDTGEEIIILLCGSDKTTPEADIVRARELAKMPLVADFDPTGYIETKEDVIATLEAALAENDPEFLLSVIGDIARSKGMVQLARELNLDRKGLYKAFSFGGNPSFITVVKVLDKLGFKLSVQQKRAT